jgi:hypothetical protein
MMMESRSKEHIDELFREGLTQGKDPADFSERDWAKLEQQLDRYAKRKSAMLWLRPLGAVAAMLLLTFGIWALWPTRQESINPQVATEQQPGQTPEEQTEDLPASKEKGTDTTAESSDSPALAAHKPVDEPPAEKPSRKELAASDQQVPTPEQDNLQMSTSELNEIVPTESTTKNQVALQTDSVKPTDQELASTKKPNDQQSIQAAEKPSVVPDPVMVQPDYAVVSEPEQRLVALTVLVAPAYNGVDNLNDGKTGTDVGLLVTLGLTKRWSFSTGALYAKKLYETGFSSNYSNGYGNDNIQAVDADCRVLDIPLNVNYAIISKGKTTISLGTGISSYIMLREDYRFVSANPYGEDPADIHLVNENQHWLSVLNLHASYQQRLSSKMSLSLQPYLKIPVKDIGYAQVRLQSLGMALSATWTL